MTTLSREALGSALWGSASPSSGAARHLLPAMRGEGRL